MYRVAEIFIVHMKYILCVNLTYDCSNQQTDITKKTHHCSFGGAIDSYTPNKKLIDHHFLTIVITPWPPCTCQLYWNTQQSNDNYRPQYLHYHNLFSIDNTALRRAAFGPGTGPIFLDNLACVGTEPMLTNCTHDTHTADCGHNEDASVHCSGIRKLHSYKKSWSYIRIYIYIYIYR